MAEMTGPVRSYDAGEVGEHHSPLALLAFGGWIDAGSAGTGAVRYLVDSLNARKLADIDPEDFYSFTDTRPLTSVVGPGQRSLHWPRAELFRAALPADPEREVLLFLAPEPNLRWRTFCTVVLDLVQRYGASTLVNVGAIFGAVHHRGAVPLTGWATEASLRRTLLRHHVTFSNYEGPTGIVQALFAEAEARSLPAAAIIGLSPNYVQGVPNPRTSHALLKGVAAVTGYPLPLADLERAGRALARQVDKLLADQPELGERVERMLNLMHVTEPAPSDDEEAGPPVRLTPGGELMPEGSSADLPSPQAVVRELEQFLRELRGNPTEPNAGDPPVEGDQEPGTGAGGGPRPG